MKYLRNPIDGKIVVATPLMAKRLARYQWEYVTQAEYIAWKRATVQAAMAKNIHAAKPKLGLFH